MLVFNFERNGLFLTDGLILGNDSHLNVGFAVGRRSRLEISIVVKFNAMFNFLRTFACERKARMVGNQSECNTERHSNPQLQQQTKMAKAGKVE